MARIDYQNYFGKICQATALRSTCEKIQVGSVLTSENHVISTGFNGSPIGFPHCTTEGCILDTHGKCQRCVHAEINALIYAHTLTDLELWTTHLPCLDCCRAIINAKIINVWFLEYYLDPKCSLFPDYDESRNYQIDMLRKAGIFVQQIKM